MEKQKETAAEPEQSGTPAMKTVEWVGSSLKDLKAMPDEIKDRFGFGIHIAQRGEFPENAKKLKGFDGVVELIEDFVGNTYRAVYMTRIAGKLYVLHCFQKKSTRGIATPKHEIETIRARQKTAFEHAKNPKP